MAHREGEFSRAPRRLGTPPSLKILKTLKGVPDGFFFLPSNVHMIHFPAPPRTPLGELTSNHSRNNVWGHVPQVPQWLDASGVPSPSQDD